MALTRRQLLKGSGLGLGAVLFAGCTIPEREMVVQSPARLPEDLVEGFDAHYATLCRVCSNPEGILVRVMEGRAKKVEGNPEYPLNLGKHGARCEAGLQALYHPDRIRMPMLRASRGEPFREVSWETALDTLLEQMRAQQSRPESVAVMTAPLRGHMGMLVERFVSAYGARHFSFETLEETVLREAVKRVFGQDRLPHFDIERASYVLSFGADFLGTWLSPINYSRQYGEFRQGEARGGLGRGTLVQVEPRFSLTAANADEWVPVRPGYEGALALSIASVIVDDGLVDAAASRRATDLVGASTLARFRPGGTEAEKTGIGAERIRALAHAFVDHQPSLALAGGSAGAHTNGLFNLTAAYMLNLLVNNVGVNGGIAFNPPSPLPGVPDAAKATPLAGWKQLADRMRSNEVQVALVRGANPAYGLPGAVKFSEALDQVPFVASVASFLDETTAQADLVLPERVYMEDWGDDIPDPAPGFQLLGVQQPVVAPFGGQGDSAIAPHAEARSFGDVLLTLAQELGGNVGQELQEWDTFQDVVRSGMQRLFEEKGGALPLRTGSTRASTFDGFWVGVLQRGGWWDRDASGNATQAQSQVASAKEPSFQGSETQYPFHLVPFPSQGVGDGSGAHLPWLQATPDPQSTAAWKTWVEINPRTAREMNVREGDVVRVVSHYGSIEALAYPHPATPPNVLSVPMGQGHRGYGRYADDRGANVLEMLAPEEDEETQAFAWAATRVRLEKTGRRTRVPKTEGMVPAVQVAHFPIVQVTRE